MTNIQEIRDALADDEIVKYPDFVKAVSDAMDELERFRADVVQWRKDWLSENDPQDGTDCVTPFDKHLYGAVPATNVEGSPLLEWAVAKWNEEVKHRPLVNVHRRTLDGTWRQVIRWAGGDPDALVGPRA